MTTLVSLASISITSFLVVIIARAAWHKVERFLETVGFAQGYGLVPDAWAPAIVRGLAAAEIAIMGLFLLPGLRPFAGLAAAALFAGYGGLMATALLRGRREIDCGCGGAPQIVSGATLVRNALLAGLALAVAAVPATPVGPAEAMVAIFGGLVIAAIYAVAEKLTSHLPNIRRAGERRISE